MQLDWAIHTSLIQKNFPVVTNQSTICDLTIFLRLRITIIVLLLQLIWCYSTGWVSNNGDLILVLIFKFRILKCGWFWMLGIIASNFLSTGNGWAIVEKDAPAVVFVGAHFFPQFLENFRSHCNTCSTLISSKKHTPIKFGKYW